jgi:BirA family biotin operon repressor/biotin-[acetyl-CoA-carboxylase] ligase
MISLNGERIKSLLRENGKGIEIRIFDEIDSTNTEAKRVFKKGESDMLIIAEKQTAGRGRQGKSFYSPEKTGVYFSLVINREMPLSFAVKATPAAAVAVAETVEELTDKKPEIKWVNDVFIDGKKVCGILTEAVRSEKSGFADGLIIGIGINVSTVDFPDEIKNIAGSLGKEPIDKNLLISRICERVFDLANDLENPKIIEEYKSRSLVLGKEISYEINGGRITATAVDIDKNFGLVIKHSDGKTETLTSGEVSVKVK